jgi:predicted small secreted protein
MIPNLAVLAVPAVLAVLPLLTTLAVLAVAFNLTLLAHLTTQTSLPSSPSPGEGVGRGGRGGQGVRASSTTSTNQLKPTRRPKMSRKRLILALVLLAAILAAGCTTLHRLTRPLAQAGAALFTSAKLADLELVGVKSGPLLPVQAGPFATSSFLSEEARHELAQLIGPAPLGVLLPITPAGETTPWWIFCPAGDLQKRCEQVPANARVTFTGRPLRGSLVLLPTRLTWSAR